MTVHKINWDEPITIPCRGGALTIGNFDGVHRGHQSLLRELTHQAQQISGPEVVLTFDPHPVRLLRPDTCPPLLTTMPERTKLLMEHGAEMVLILNTTWDLLQLEAYDFFEQFLLNKLQPRHMVPGYNFHFGHNREGNVHTLEKWCREAGIGFTKIAPSQAEGTAISSSRIRASIAAGRVEEAARLLGRPYSLTGRVGQGQRRGKQIGFPTANLQNIETLIPADGVYALRTTLNGELYAAAANIGPNPTFGEDVKKVEIHIIGFDGELHGQDLTVHFIKRLRDTKPFANVEELKAQLQRDVDAAKTMAEVE